MVDAAVGPREGGVLCQPASGFAARDDDGRAGGTIEAEDEFDLAHVPTVRAPTLLVGGGRDRFYDDELFARTADLIPGCVLEMHPRRGHITVLSDPHAVAQIRRFLNDESNWRR
jgi:pimeloyl-ACP methyl ester carboxylesterase